MLLYFNNLQILFSECKPKIVGFLSFFYFVFHLVHVMIMPEMTFAERIRLVFPTMVDNKFKD